MNPTRQELEALIPHIELVSIKEIKLNPNNPRTISQKDFDALVKSVESFWQMLLIRPVVLGDDDRPIGGNMKTLACKKAGFQFVPCIRASFLTEQQQREFLIKDNNHAGQWNMEELANSWSGDLLQDWGMNLAGFGAPPPLPSSFQPGEDDIGAAASRSSTATDRKPAASSFNILVKCDTELARVQLENLLTEAGYHLDEHFYHV